MLWIALWKYVWKFRWKRQITRNTEVPNLDEMEEPLEKCNLPKQGEKLKNSVRFQKSISN